MPKPAIPGLTNLPGMNAMNETLDFVKNLWGGVAKPSLGLPGMVMPTLSVEEIEKQIKDLKAVEAWLNVNTQMVRSTIQALEVQAGTITALQSMGQALSAVTSKAAPAEDRASARKEARAALQEEFRAKPAAKKAAVKTAAKSAPKAAEAQVPNPALWWNMLQDQFKQAVSSAMSPDAMGAAAGAMGSMLRQPVVKEAMKEVVKDAVRGAVKGAAKTAVKTVAKKAAVVTRKKAK